ncbi:MAG: dihydropteroate synthase [Actinomycetota bacterium]
MNWRHAGGALDCARGRLVGIVNATPDSFTDRGAHWGVERSVAHGLRLAGQGADVVEVGGESLRAGRPLDPEEEIARVVPVIRALRGRVEVPLAVDTFKPPVAEAALAAGASILNDPTGLRDPEMLRVAAASGAGVVVTHYFGRPKVHSTGVPPGDVVDAVLDWARGRLAACDAAGIDRERVALDPGIGLGKTPPQDLEILRRVGEVVALGRPVFVPISNKKVIGGVTGAPAKRRLGGTAALLVWCRSRGATLFRVHNVKFLSGVRDMADALATGAPPRWHDLTD